MHFLFEDDHTPKIALAKIRFTLGVEGNFEQATFVPEKLRLIAKLTVSNGSQSFRLKVIF